MLKILPKMLSGISQKFHPLCYSVLPLCLHYVPMFLQLSWNILISECSVSFIKVFLYEVTERDVLFC